MAMRPNLLRTGLVLLWCAQSAHVHAAKGWLHAQFTHDRASLSQMHQGFDDMDVDGKGVIPFWGQFRTRTGSSRTLTITAELRPGTYQLTRLKNIHTVDLGMVKQVFALTSDFPDLPPLVIEAGKVLDMGIFVVQPGTDPKQPMQLLQVSEKSVSLRSELPRVGWEGAADVKAIDANLRHARSIAPVIGWAVGRREGEEFLYTALGRIYWRDSTSGWHVLDMPQIAHVNHLVWNEASGAYWLAMDHHPLQRTPSLTLPEWSEVPRKDIGRRVHHLGTLPDGRLWMYEFGFPVSKGPFTWVSALTASGRWQRVAITKGIAAAYDTPEHSHVGGAIMQQYDMQRRQFVVMRSRPDQQYQRVSVQRWYRHENGRAGDLEVSVDGGASWVRWGSGPRQKLQVLGLDLRANGHGFAMMMNTGLLNPRPLAKLLRSTNGGATWEELAELPGFCMPMPSLAAEDQLVVYCADGTLALTISTGVWRPWSPHVPDQPRQDIAALRLDH